MTEHPVRKPFLTGLVEDLPADLRGAVVAIGNFDGMHRGHQAVLAAALAQAEAAGVPCLMLTFEPHPRSVFQPDQPVFRLTPPAAKARLTAAFGLDGMIVNAFTREFAAESPAQFVEEVIVGSFAARHVVVGWDFHYGHRRSGTVDSLQAAGAAAGFGVTVVGPFEDEGGAVVSSSRVRAALAAGDVGGAAGLLGYRWFFDGTVAHGDKRGRTIGYPTANIRTAPDFGLAHGIYAVFVQLDGARLPGVASFGRRPTFDNGAPVFETFLFDFAGDLYGKALQVTPVSYLRPELKFDGVDALVAQMDRDSAEARAVLAATTPVSGLDLALADA
ncbi:bifunctional riboflavin kinase/FAD synthetase [Methylobrevis albus]|uniref:Riboflavin biosynthesis protein n=1 Tax=Methylobrevis albus TaxID=2793297 RepID=A0A931I2P0_9HYPH|nr:bifunctional riboflavin kinase/FAD synthetase [Methylobrevis albus]MBH0238188.1 bifunctional riboflavin kinase/FAD synthetase [Methylobrevis albus]